MTEKDQTSLTDELIMTLDKGIDGVKSLFSGSKRPSAEEKLLLLRAKKHRRLKRHRRAYVLVNLFLLLVNVLTWSNHDDPVPWVLFVLGGWGIGLGMQWLGFRDWLAENRVALDRAEAVLGNRLTNGSGGGELALAPVDPEDLEWGRLLTRATELLAHAEQALAHLGDLGQSARLMLRSGADDVAKLGEGQRRLRQTLRDMGAQGTNGNHEREIAELRSKINMATEERLRGLYKSNLALMEARQSKIVALREDLDRIRASVEGFILAAENIRLDAARIESGSEAPQAIRRLGEPLERMAREVSILREVEAELERM